MIIELFRNIFAPPRHLILLVLAIWLGASLAEKRSERYSISKDDLNALVYYGFIGFIIGGRLSFALQNISAFIQSPRSIFSVNPDLFDTFGGISVFIIIALVLGQRRNLSFWSTLDALTPFFAILAIGLSLSHLAAGTAFGIPTTQPWGIDLWNATRHPTQIYATIASLLIFSLLWFQKQNLRSGILFLTFTSLTAGTQIFLGMFRANSILLFNSIKQEQVISLVVLILSFIFIELRYAQTKKV
ncbi:MAG: prolipoprotein diacylglyceryl transferase [Anaerolineales bacterium]|nr:prolipoprotein diacylglyceryl transferase [Anaerolineales bacterium]